MLVDRYRRGNSSVFGIQITHDDVRKSLIRGISLMTAFAVVLRSFMIFMRSFWNRLDNISTVLILVPAVTYTGFLQPRHTSSTCAAVHIIAIWYVAPSLSLCVNRLSVRHITGWGFPLDPASCETPSCPPQLVVDIVFGCPNPLFGGEVLKWSPLALAIAVTGVCSNCW